MIDYNEILNKIVSSKNKTNEGISKYILKIDTIGNVITGRFLPNIKDINPKDGSIPTEISSYFHFIKSKLDNSTIFINCPNTIGERCPVCGKSVAMWRSDSNLEKEHSKGLRRQHSFYTNFYIISDLKKPENNGKVLLLKYGKQIDMKIKGALEGDLAKFYGTRIYRLDGEGCTFMLKAEQNSEKKDAWPTYANSTFLPASPIEGMTEAKMKQIMEDIICITPSINVCKPAAELIEIMNKHYFINDMHEQSKTLVDSVSNVQKEVVQQKAAPKVEEKVETVDESDLDKMISELG